VQPKTQAYFTKVDFINKLPDVLQISHQMNRTAENLTALYVKFQFSEDMGNMHGTFNLKFQHRKNMINYSSLELNYCEAFQMVHKHYMMQMVFTGIRRVSNLPLKCPFKKNQPYYVNGFVIDTKLIPSYLPQVAFSSDITVLSKDRDVVHIFLSGQVEK
ncbi:hypothetical protein KR093_007354, partial [Drosophila rubida]